MVSAVVAACTREDGQAAVVGLDFDGSGAWRLRAAGALEARRFIGVRGSFGSPSAGLAEWSRRWSPRATMDGRVHVGWGWSVAAFDGGGCTGVADGRSIQGEGSFPLPKLSVADVSRVRTLARLISGKGPI